jgi:hypothetical protein
MNTYERETVDFQPVNVTVGGAPVTAGVSLCVVPEDQRPAAFIPAVVRGATIGVGIAGMSPGTYDIYAKVAAPPDAPVFKCVSFIVS